MNGTERAIWQFAWERFAILAGSIAKDLQQLDPSGIYGDDAGSSYGDDCQLESLWDEYCHEIQEGPHDGLESAWDQTIRPFAEAAISALSYKEQALLSLATDEGSEFDPESSDLPPICRDGLIDEVLEALTHQAANYRIGTGPAEIRTLPPNSFADIRSFLTETKVWRPPSLELDGIDFSPDFCAAADTLIGKVVEATTDRFIDYIDWRNGLPLPGDAGYRADEDLPVNSWPLNREAKRWFQEAKISPDPGYLYLVQLLQLGFAQKLQIPGQGQNYWDDLELAANQLDCHSLNPVQVMRWFLSNPNGGDQGEQNDTLRRELESAPSWQVAAQNLMQWFYDLSH